MRLSSGKNELGLAGFWGGGGRKLLALMVGLKEEEVNRDFNASVAEEGWRAKEGVLLEDLSRSVRRSQRQEGQKPLNLSSGWRSQLKEERRGCGGGGGGGVASAAVGFITVRNPSLHLTPDHITTALHSAS